MMDIPHPVILRPKAEGSPAVVFLAGPTAVGKSAVAAELAGILGAEIISCDAMQVYREANIASDKPSLEMRRRAVHHLIDVVSVEEEFNAARYRDLALAALTDIESRGRRTIFVGGSGMYMMALLDGLFEESGIDPALRARLEARSLDDLREELRRVDPQAAGRIQPNDRYRIQRALEVFHHTGVPISQRQKDRGGLWGNRPLRIFGLERPRAQLYARADDRVEAMFREGLVDEVKGLVARRLSLTGSRIIGLPEVAGALAGEYDMDRARELMKLHTRHYIKRQLTWFRKDQRIVWLTIDGDETPGTTARRVAQLLELKSS